MRPSLLHVKENVQGDTADRAAKYFLVMREDIESKNIVTWMETGDDKRLDLANGEIGKYLVEEDKCRK